jgi:recombination protein RecT
MIKINYKLLPKSAEMAIAMEADEGVRVDLSPKANAGEVTEHNYIPGEVVSESNQEDSAS